MCGIIYSKDFTGRPVNKTIFKRYKAQRSRGIDGFGFYAPQENRLTHNTREGRILKLLKRSKADEIMFHHRLPTSTLNVRTGCHPYSTKDFFENNYVLIHNGVIYNDEELRTKHKKFGVEYVSEQRDGSFNDSEALLYEVALYLEGWQKTIEAKGSMAFIVAKKDKSGKPMGVYFGRNYGNPLKIKETAFSLTLASEGKGEDVEPHKMHFYDYRTHKITSEACTFPTGGTYEYSTNYYGGMGFGFQSREEWESDNEFSGLKGARSDRDVEKILRKWDMHRIESNRVRRIKEQLLYDNYENPFDAVVSGEYEIEQLKKREGVLENLTHSGLIMDDDVDELMSIPDKIYYIGLAIQELEREASVQREQEFFHIPNVSVNESGKARAITPIH